MHLLGNTWAINEDIGERLMNLFMADKHGLVMRKSKEQVLFFFFFYEESLPATGFYQSIYKTNCF